MYMLNGAAIDIEGTSFVNIATDKVDKNDNSFSNMIIKKRKSLRK